LKLLVVTKIVRFLKKYIEVFELKVYLQE